VKQQHPSLIMVDYTVPQVIHEMVDLYIKHRTPFVMGTTGGDRAKILADVRAAGLYAVIAPQMGKQVCCVSVFGGGAGGTKGMSGHARQGAVPGAGRRTLVVRRQPTMHVPPAAARRWLPSRP
jgi:hypothetical protein